MFRKLKEVGVAILLIIVILALPVLSWIAGTLFLFIIAFGLIFWDNDEDEST